jgi:hypothetical protein
LAAWLISCTSSELGSGRFVVNDGSDCAYECYGSEGN